MKFLGSQISYFLQGKNTRKNIKMLIKFLAILITLITAYSILFHYIMAAEGHDHSWITGFYWTLTVMSTLGFGDITFTSDLGKVFSLIVLLSGILFLLVLLPFTFIQFFYAPWIEAERQSRTPRSLPSHVSNHVIITGYNSVTGALIERLVNHRVPYTLIIEDVHTALEFYDMGFRAALGNIDDPETYRLMRSFNAAMVVSAENDEMNTNIAFTVREFNENVPIICTADSPDSVDILKMAGASLVLQLSDILGKSLARRTIGGDRKANIIGTFDELVIAEAPATGTPLVGKTLAESKLREVAGITVIGVWDRGHFSIPGPDTLISTTMVLVIAGSERQIEEYEEVMCIYQVSIHHVVIIGAGRVGAAVASSLDERNIEYIIIDKNDDPHFQDKEFVMGNAADIKTLMLAGIDKASAAIVTTHDDATNIYLTKYCRGLRPDMQIISRANVDRNITTLHRAGADFVMSYASLGANAIYNYLESSEIVMLAEGLDIFKRKIPGQLIGKTIIQSRLRQETGCSVVAIQSTGKMTINPDPSMMFERDDEIVLIGSAEAEKKYISKYVTRK